MNGTASAAPARGSVAADWTIQGVGDFNGDGKADILWRHTSGRVDIWLMNGTSISERRRAGGVGPTGPSRASATSTATARRTSSGGTLGPRRNLAHERHQHQQHRLAGQRRAGLDHPGRRRLQRRRQGGHPLAPHLGLRRHLAHERHRSAAPASPAQRRRRTGPSRASATSTATARPTSSGATPRASSPSGS